MGTGFSQLSIPEAEMEASGVQRPGRKRIHRATVQEVGQAPEQSLGPQVPLVSPRGPGRSESVLGPARPGIRIFTTVFLMIDQNWQLSR